MRSKSRRFTVAEWCPRAREWAQMVADPCHGRLVTTSSQGQADTAFLTN